MMIIVSAFRCGNAVSSSPTRFAAPPAVCVNIASRGSGTYDSIIASTRSGVTSRTMPFLA